MELMAVEDTVKSIAGPLLVLMPFLSGDRRLRSSINDNLDILDRLEKSSVGKQSPEVTAALQNRIAVETLRLARIKTRKKPVPWGTVVFLVIMIVPLGWWTYVLDRNGFSWWSLLPGAICALLIISFFGQFMNRELPPKSKSESATGNN
jgi:hypothetical protein